MGFFRSTNQRVADIVAMPIINGVLILSARILASLIFIISGYGKIAAYAGTEQYMQAMGVPAAMLPLVILLELGGGVALLLGFQVRFIALALAIFSIISAFIFHAGDDPISQINLLKNLAMAGGLLAFTVFGAGRFSLDAEKS
jgi:putative oxidoreductase